MTAEQRETLASVVADLRRAESDLAAADEAVGAFFCPEVAAKWWEHIDAFQVAQDRACELRNRLRDRLMDGDELGLLLAAAEELLS